MKRLITGLAIFAVSLGYGFVAHAQCPGGVCPVQQPQPVRQIVYSAALVVADVAAPRQCPVVERRQPVRDAIRKVFGGKCK